MLKADLHIHAKEDEPWIKYNAKDMIDRAAELNFDVLSFSFHNVLFYPDDLVRCAESKGILLIPGVELTIKKKHVLVYGLKDISGIKDLNDLRGRKDCIVVAAHPFFKAQTCLGNELIKNIDVFDGIEYCHFYNHLFNFNKRAVAVAKKYNKALIGNSDCHMMELQFNRTYSLIDAEKNIKSVFEAIRNRKVNVVSEPLPLMDVAKILFKMKPLESFK